MQLNQNPLKEIVFGSFKGGYAGAKGVTSLTPEEALDLDNIVILPSGGGFKNRQGNAEEPHSGNISTVTNAVQGIGAFKTASFEYLVWATAIGSDTVVFTHDLTTSTHTIRYTLTSAGTGADNIITMFKMQSKTIGVWQNRNAPFKIDFSTEASPSGALLSGTPPNGRFGFSWNNVAWIGNTSSDPSKLYYSILNDPEDWSSAGSGFVNPSPKDGDELITCVPVSTNSFLYFKRNSIYQVVGRADPFAVFPLFQEVGCVGKHAAIGIDGLVYFITPQGRMRITDGTHVYSDQQSLRYSYVRDIPQLSYADDLWDRVVKSRLPFIQAVHQQGDSFDHIVFLVTMDSGTTNNAAIIWDVKNVCWLRDSTGYNGNCVTTLADGTVYMGGYLGRTYKLDVDSKFTDDSGVAPALSGSNTQVLPVNPIPIRWFWRTDDISLNSLEKVVQIDRVNVMSQFSGNGHIKISYGYDGFHDTASVTKAVVPATFILGTSILGVDKLGGIKFSTDMVRPLGRGQTFNVKFEGSDNVASDVTRFTLAGRQAATKVKEVR